MPLGPQRWEQLELLLDGMVHLDVSGAGIQDLNDWFRLSVEPSPDGSSRLANRHAVVLSGWSGRCRDALGQPSTRVEDDAIARPRSIGAGDWEAYG